MKNRLMASLSVLTLALAGALSFSMQAQTTEEGPGPSEQPNAPMEMGQPQYAPPSQNRDMSQTGQPESDQPGEEAQPGPSGEGPAKTDQGVGRISMIHGEVSTRRGDSGDWSAAVLNQPVLNGDKVSTAAGGRAEVQLDFANILRLGSNAQANIANFTHKYIQIQISQGLADYSVFNESEAEPEIDTPNIAVHPAHKDVVLRVEVRPDGDSIIIVRKGDAQISTPQGIADLKAGEMATVRGSGDDARYKISEAPERDDWDRWNSDRDRMIHNASSFRHTNKYYVGAEDLDANGKWENAPDYGQVWVPNEPEGWVPYRDGNWTYEPYYGWTWVGYEPWGWAPYHYGRWMYYGNSWAWWPGPVWGGVGFYRPLWAPAYVSFFGFGGGFGVGFGWGGWGGFGWLPIGPCDRFFPWWGGYGGRFGAVNINTIHVTTVNRLGGISPLHGGTAYSNLRRINDAHISRAVSTVGAGKFGAGRTTAVAATHAQLSGAHMMTGNMPVVPTRASLSASGRVAAPSTIHNTGAQHFAGTQSTARPQSFQQQTAHLQQSMQQNHFSPVAAGGAANESRVAESRGAVSANGKPSAGTTASSRELNNGGSRVAGNAAAANENGSRGSVRSFAPPNSSARSEGASQERSASSSSYRPESSTPNRGEPNRSEWKPFTPPSRGSASTAGSGAASGSYSRGESGSYWNRTAPSSTYSREGSSSNYERGSSSRPQLNMRQPIVQPRSSGSYGGYRGSPSYGGRSGGYSAPRSAAPTSGGHYSAPSSGGSHSSGGGSHSSGGSSHSSSSHSGGKH
jgi:hypothetical protein